MSYECVCDYEPATVYRSKWVKTSRKEHLCAECFRKIMPGESYQYTFGVWDGRVESFPACSDCWGLKEWVAAHVPCLCWAHGNIIDDCISEARAWSPNDAPGLLFGAYRRLINGRRRKTAQVRS